MLARRILLTLCVASQLTVAGLVGGQETPAADAETAQQAFDDRFAEWKALMKRINSLRIEYQAAAEPRRGELLSSLDEAFKAADQLVPTVVEAALEAYRLAPNQNQEVKNFLTEVAKYYFSTDNYDPLLPVAKVLVEGGIGQPQVAVWGGIAAVATGDFDSAAQLMKAAAPVFHDPQQAQEQYVQMAAGMAAGLEQLKSQWDDEQAIRAAEAEADDLPRVLLKTNKGPITIELFENEAPNTVKSFISLVENDFYNGLTFHRVLPNFMAQGGCPEGTGSGGPGYNIPCECDDPQARLHFRGTLSMAHAGKDTGGSQFFLTFLPTPHLDQRHTVFGRVIEGFDVLSKLQRRDPQKARGPADTIVEATVIRKRPDTDYSKFEKS